MTEAAAHGGAAQGASPPPETDPAQHEAAPAPVTGGTGLGDVEAEAAAVRAQKTALNEFAASTAAVAEFNVEAARALPHLSATLAARAKALSSLKGQIASLDQRAAHCRQRALLLAERCGVSVEDLGLHDPDAEVLDGN